MELRLAREEDREIILKIYDDGSKKLKSLGLDQWQGCLLYTSDAADDSPPV